MRVLGPAQENRRLPLAAPVGLEQPLEKGVVRPQLKVRPEILDISIPKHLPEDRAAQGADQ